MRGRSTFVWPVLALAALAAWWLLRGPAGAAGRASRGGTTAPVAAQEAQSRGSALPCAVPLAWRVAGVDPRFGLTGAEARAAVDRAAALWERAVGHALFVRDPDGGFPIRFVYDERQSLTGERRAARQELDRAGERLRRMRAEADAAREALAEDVARYERQWEALQRRVAAHNARVEELNAAGGASPEQAAAIQREAAALDREQAALRTQADALERAQRAHQREVERLNREVDAYNRRAAEIEARFPAMAVESGRYREQVQTRNGTVVAVDRSIDIYQFQDRHELMLVVAHELGHALGLGHAEVADAIMSARTVGGVGTQTVSEVQSADLRMLRELCPALR